MLNHGPSCLYAHVVCVGGQRVLQVSPVAGEEGAHQDSLPRQGQGGRLQRVTCHLQAHSQVSLIKR